MRVMEGALWLVSLALSASLVQADNGRNPQFCTTPRTLDKEAKAIVVSRWNAWPFGCSGATRSQWDDLCNAWYASVSNFYPPPSGHGSKAYYRGGFFHNGNIVDSQFADEDRVNWGEDSGRRGVDDSEAVMIGLHGGHGYEQRWRGSVRVNEWGGGDCGAWQGHMVLGDPEGRWGGEAKFVHLSSCHSMCELNEGYQHNWRDTFDGAHQVTGFYGVMYVKGWLRYLGFGNDVFDNAIADAWLDHMYDDGGWWGSDDDQCPVALLVGESLPELFARAFLEEYDCVTPDPTSRSWFLYVSIGGCDPLGHDP